ncbi:uncharacterized protein LOC124278549 [Haliotis rubra]|uniref:uncharacterized protein LOC124278549 n=1 Tax=Haliotis rubra TaxID=36100 RepID=UPI001EE5F0EB|nr:uncharacterized protein LOC124278549 [Haliotis rubra]
MVGCHVTALLLLVVYAVTVQAFFLVPDSSHWQPNKMTYIYEQLERKREKAQDRAAAAAAAAVAAAEEAAAAQELARKQQSAGGKSRVLAFYPWRGKRNGDTPSSVYMTLGRQHVGDTEDYYRPLTAV